MNSLCVLITALTSFPLLCTTRPFSIRASSAGPLVSSSDTASELSGLCYRF